MKSIVRRASDYARYHLALAGDEHEKYHAWASRRLGEIDELTDGFFVVDCTLHDETAGKAMVEAVSRHQAKEKATALVAMHRLAQDYDVDNRDWTGRWFTSLVLEPDLRAEV